MCFIFCYIIDHADGDIMYQYNSTYYIILYYYNNVISCTRVHLEQARRACVPYLLVFRQSFAEHIFSILL